MTAQAVTAGPLAPTEGGVVLVTGASSGIGEALVRHLAACGARVVCCARRADRLAYVGGLGERVRAVVADVTVEEDLEAFVDDALSVFGRIDGLVNNAGVSKAGPALRETVDDLRWTLEANLVAPFALARKVVPAMRRTGGGAIVNVASVMGIRSVDQLPEAGYVASKAALIALTRELASQWGRHGVRVNAVAPGFYLTEMTADLLAGDTLPPFLANEVPLQRYGQLSELVPAVEYLLGDGSTYTTGHTLVVDGGFTTR